MKLLKLFFTVLLLQSFYSLEGQVSYTLNFLLKDLPGMKVYVVGYYGDQENVIDSAITDSRGNVVFIFNDDDDVGMYRLQKDKQTGFDFIFNRENISLVSNDKFNIDHLKVIKSKENEIFYDYFRRKYDLENRIDLLTSFLKYYPTTDTFYNAAARHAMHLSGIYGRYLDSIQENFGGTMAARVITLDRLQDIRPGELDPGTIARLRSTYFDSIDMSDSLILNTPFLPSKVLDYLSLYIIQGASRDIQEKRFMQAVDSLMKFTEHSHEVREMVVNYLINGFQAYGFEKVMSYLVENYVLGQKCVSDQQEEKLKLRIEGFRKMALGNSVPDFHTVDANGDSVSLSGNMGNPTLLIFWSGSCPHCEAVMPDLISLYDKVKGKVRFISISVDTDEKTWRDAISRDNIPWINIAELQGWDGRIVKGYYVYATPTFLLISPDLKIVAKPAGFAELKNALMN